MVRRGVMSASNTEARPEKTEETSCGDGGTDKDGRMC